MNNVIKQMIEDIYDCEYVNIGQGNRIHRTAVVMCSNISWGTNNTFGPFSVIGAPGHIRDAEGFYGKIIFGDNNYFGPFFSIHQSISGVTQIGSNNIFMAKVIVGHDVVLHDNCEVGNGVIISGYCKVDSGVQIKAGAILRNRIHIGELATIGMGAVVVNTVGDRDTVVGNPAKIKK